MENFGVNADFVNGIEGCMHKLESSLITPGNGFLVTAGRSPLPTALEAPT